MILNVNQNARLTDIRKTRINILNDNGMAIAPNVGGINKITSDTDYIHLCRNFFDGCGIKYFCVENGHSISNLVDAYELAKNCSSPSIVHVKTIKGNGLDFAAEHPYKMHFSMPFNPSNGKGASPTIAGKTYAVVAAEALKEKIVEDDEVFVITPATPYASSLDDLKNQFPERIFDVGMAEQHAVVMACGMALDGLKPIVCFQTTFMQRAFDQLIHDMCFMDLAVTILGVRSGFAGLDSPTHHGIYDIPYLRSIPNLNIVYPVNSYDMSQTIKDRLKNPKGPMVILHPYEAISKNEVKNFSSFNEDICEVVKGNIGIIFCIGNTLEQALELRQLIKESNMGEYSVACVRTIKPTPTDKIIELIGKCENVISYEESTLSGGLGSQISEVLADNGSKLNMIRIGIDDIFVPTGEKLDLAKYCGIDPHTALEKIKNQFIQNEI